jgi:hypothetical protein
LRCCRHSLPSPWPTPPPRRRPQPTRPQAARLHNAAGRLHRCHPALGHQTTAKAAEAASCARAHPTRQDDPLPTSPPKAAAPPTQPAAPAPLAPTPHHPPAAGANKKVKAYAAAPAAAIPAAATPAAPPGQGPVTAGGSGPRPPRAVHASPASTIRWQRYVTASMASASDRVTLPHSRG